MRVQNQEKSDQELIADFLRHGERLRSVRLKGNRISCIHWEGDRRDSWTANQALMCWIPYSGRMTHKREAEIWREFKRQVRAMGGEVAFPEKTRPTSGEYEIAP